MKLHPSKPCFALHWHIQSEPIWPRPMKPELEAEQVAFEAYRRKCTLSTFSGHPSSSLCSPSTYHTASGNRSGGSLRTVWIHACGGLRLLLTCGKQTNNTTSYNHTDNYRATIIGLFFNTYSILNASWDLGFRGHPPLFIQSFLSEHPFRVRVGSTLSELHEQKMGVLQLFSTSRLTTSLTRIRTDTERKIGKDREGLMSLPYDAEVCPETWDNTS